MSPDTVHEAEVLVSSLPTKSVTFMPSRATVVREIQDVAIKPGPNEITIHGLDPNVDIDSIRVDGAGPATITDIQTEIVPRHEQFRDVYLDDDLGVEDPSADDSEPDYGIDDSKLQAARQAYSEAEAALAQARDSKASAASTLQFLDSYGRGMNAKDVDVAAVDKFLKFYREQRAVESQREQQATVEIAKCEERVEITREKMERLKDVYDRAKRAASKEIRCERAKRERERQQQINHRIRERRERERFFTATVSKITVHLYGYSADTPAPSRRSSITERHRSLDITNEKPDSVSLRVTYVVPGASWAPRYELSINTPSSSARIVYRAEFQNSSAETWRDAKVILSTSQTSFAGLDERIPILQPWHVKLGAAADNDTAVWESGPIDQAEMHARSNRTMPWRKASSGAWQGRVVPESAPQYQMRPQNPQELMQMQMNHQMRLVQAQAAQNALTASTAGAPNPAAPQAMVQMAQRPAPAASGADLFDATTAEGPESDSDSDRQTLSPPSNLLEHQDSVRQDYGLTTTYDLAGQRTLAPSSVQRRHVLADLDLNSVTLSHVLIPKLRPAAFLKARIQNTSSVTLLRGKAGMTVDGTFLGSATLSPCAPNDFFNLSLGVDPTILVTYGKPTVRRATAGFFNKEDWAVFTRACWIKNTKGSAVSVTVYDQVPVSEDEKLRVHILEPMGLDKEGDKVKGKGPWSATLGKNGEVKWVVHLEKGKDVKLVLEYETRLPSGNKIVGLE